MKLKLSKRQTPVHTEIVSSISWSGNNALYSVSDDKTIKKWDSSGESIGEKTQTTDFITAFAISPANRSYPETFALGTEHGELKIFSSNAEDTKTVEAGQGAILDIKWTMDGNALATSGEDGQVRVAF